MKPYRDRLREYENQKAILMQICTSSEELMKELKKLARKLKI